MAITLSTPIARPQSRRRRKSRRSRRPCSLRYCTARICRRSPETAPVLAFEPDAFPDRADLQAERVASISMEQSGRVVAGVDQLAARGQDRGRGANAMAFLARRMAAPVELIRNWTRPKAANARSAMSSTSVRLVTSTLIASALLTSAAVSSAPFSLMSAQTTLAPSRAKMAPAPGRLSVLQDAFRRHHALQCGFCTAGILMSPDIYLRDHADPSEQELREYLSGHLCRCTGYVPIVAAALDAAVRLREEAAHA